MKLVIDISEYDREWIKNTYGIPQDIDVAIARAIIHGKSLPKPITEYEVKVSYDYDPDYAQGWNDCLDAITGETE